MKIEIDLPNVPDENKTDLINQAQNWDGAAVTASVGRRFMRHLRLVNLNAPKAIIDNSKELLADAIFRYRAMVTYFESQEPEYEDCEEEEGQ